MTALMLDDQDKRALSGSDGAAHQLAMEVVVEMAGVVGARQLIDIESAHIDGCLPFGRVALDLPQRLIKGGGRVTVPTTLNVSALDLLHPELPAGNPDTAALGRHIAAAYEALGCQPTWTCAPYQLPERPALGSHVAWAESNAIVFANSVLGARTSRYGDFFDICAALTGRVPEAGLHLDANRGARAVFRLDGLNAEQSASDLLFALLGTLIGERSGGRLPAVVGLPAETSEDQLKALGAAAASAGSVAMFHAVGITPEAGTLDEALQGESPEVQIDVGPVDLRAVRARLGATTEGRLTAVALGTPHFSLAEIGNALRLLDGRPVAPGVAVYVSTARGTYRLAEEQGWIEGLEGLGVTVLVDTCTYLRPMVELGAGVVLTNSAKWAWYAPMTLGVEVVIGSLVDCLNSAVSGRLELSDGF
jgi:predicted aconitase